VGAGPVCIKHEAGAAFDSDALVCFCPNKPCQFANWYAFPAKVDSGSCSGATPLQFMCGTGLTPCPQQRGPHISSIQPPISPTCQEACPFV
jgi:hypothetical protein